MAFPALSSVVQNTQSGVRRLSELDALRGLAALSVVLWHFFCATYTLPESWGTFFMPTYWATRGDGAVVVFFVLSGFVLSLPFLAGRGPSYKVFVIRRICRIYLPYLAGIGLSILAVTFVAQTKRPGLSDWLNQVFAVPFRPWTALEHLFLAGNIHSNAYNNAIWSLIQEMRVSLLFPLVFWVVSRNRVVVNLGLCALLSGLYTCCSYFKIEQDNGYQTGYCFSLHVIGLFIIGMLLARHRAGLIKVYRRLPTVAKVVLLLLAMGLYRRSMEFKIVFFRDYGAATGAAVFIISALGSVRLSAFLKRPFFTFLGNISYAMYLNHITVIIVVMSLAYPAWPLWGLGPTIVAGTLLLSLPFWRYLEKPAIRWGRSLTQQREPTLETIEASGPLTR